MYFTFASSQSLAARCSLYKAQCAKKTAEREIRHRNAHVNIIILFRLGTTYTHPTSHNSYLPAFNRYT